MSHSAARGSPPRAGHSLYTSGYSHHSNANGNAPWPAGPSRSDARNNRGPGGQLIYDSPLSHSGSSRFEDAVNDTGNEGTVNGGYYATDTYNYNEPYTSPPRASNPYSVPPASLQFPQATVGGSRAEERFTTSQSMLSLSSSLRGKRAPAPAALKLRPERSERRPPPPPKEAPRWKREQAYQMASVYNT